MLTLKIDNSEFENKFLEYAKSQKKAVEDVAIEAMNYFMSMKNESKGISYTKKDPLKHMHKIMYAYDECEDLSDVKPYSHVADSASYIHDLRRKKKS